jgi:hypothetical protein
LAGAICPPVEKKYKIKKKKPLSFMGERTERITVRLTPGEEEWIIKRADKADVSKSRYMRKVVLGEFPQTEAPYKNIHRQMRFNNGITQAKMKKIFQTEMPKVNSNINQIARRLNSGQVADNKMLKEVKGIRANHQKMTRIIIKALR